MSRKHKKHEKEPNHERWLVSYADFITLLFAVFTTLYAMSQTDKKKAEEVMASIRESFGYASVGAAHRPSMIDTRDLRIIPSIRPEILTPGKREKDQGGKTRAKAEEKDFREIKAAIEAYLLKNGAQQKVSVNITKRGLVVSLKEAGFFNSGSAAIKSESYPLLRKVAESLAYSNVIRVEGNTDTDPISTREFKSNWELSTARSANIVHYLIDYQGFSPENISATGFGEFRPVADNTTVEGKQKNRRVDIVLLSPESESSEPGRGE